MITVAIVGASGYVGSALCLAMADKSATRVIAITRANYAEMQRHTYDVLINSAMPSERYWAKNNPEKDFVATVQKTADLLYGWKYGKFIQISTLSARCQLDTIYGRHKAAAEKICKFSNSLIVRLGPMYSNGLSKGVLIDILHSRKVFVSRESRYCFAPLEFVTVWITQNIERTGIVEVGAWNAVALQEVAKHLGADVEFEGALDHQEVEHPEPDFPDARKVFGFLDEMRNTLARAER